MGVGAGGAADGAGFSSGGGASAGGFSAGAASAAGARLGVAPVVLLDAAGADRGPGAAGGGAGGWQPAITTSEPARASPLHNTEIGSLMEVTCNQKRDARWVRKRRRFLEIGHGTGDQGATELAPGTGPKPAPAVRPASFRWQSGGDPAPPRRRIMAGGSRTWQETSPGGNHPVRSPP